MANEELTNKAKAFLHILVKDPDIISCGIKNGKYDESDVIRARKGK